MTALRRTERATGVDTVVDAGVDFGAGTTRRRVFGVDRDVVLAIAARDLSAVRRSKSIMLPMILVPTILLAVLPLVLGWVAANASSAGIERFLDNVPDRLADSIGRLPEREQLVVLVNGYLLAPLFLIVPLMVSAVLAADAFAGEKERRTIESLLHLPATDREVYVAKMLTAFGPAVVVSWVGFVVFAVVSNAVAWPVMQRLFVPTALWLVMIFWVAPAVAALGLGIMVRVSARTRTTQEANQLGGTVILPLIVLTLGQATGLLLVDLSVALAVGAVTWLVALFLNVRGAKRFSRDHMATQV